MLPPPTVLAGAVSRAGAVDVSAITWLTGSDDQRHRKYKVAVMKAADRQPWVVLGVCTLPDKF